MTIQAQPVALDEHPSTDYPAAHSMDTIWFAVDENGELGKFYPSSTGVVPVLEGMEPGGAPTGPYKARDDDPRYYEALQAHCQAQYGVDIYCEEPEFTDDGPMSFLPPRYFHFQAQSDECNDLYSWYASPERPLTIADLPEKLRGGRYLLQLKDYDFRSREPVDIFDTAKEGYARHYPFRLYPETLDQTIFPVNGPWDNTLFLDCMIDEVPLFGVDGKMFFACDDEGFLAVFRTDRFGAIPFAKQSDEEAARRGAFWSLADADTWQEMLETSPAAFPRGWRLEQYGAPLRIEDVYDVRERQWLVKSPLVVLLDSAYPIPEKTVQISSEVFQKIPVIQALKIPQGWLTFRDEDSSVIREAILAGGVKQVWRAEWARHWLEYPFGLAAPRLFGFYQYDASWHHAIPYVRIGAPAEPVRLEQFDVAWREKMNPVHFAGVRFAEAELVQPFEHVPSRSHSYAGHDSGRQAGQVWLDSRLERVHHLAVSEVDKFRGSEDLLLRRARRHIQRIRDLALR